MRIFITVESLSKSLLYGCALFGIRPGHVIVYQLLTEGHASARLLDGELSAPMTS